MTDGYREVAENFLRCFLLTKRHPETLLLFIASAVFFFFCYMTYKGTVCRRDVSPLLVLSISDENQKTLMSCPLSRESAVCLVAAEHAAVRRECLALLSLFSETPRGRGLAIDSLDVQT